MTGRVLALVVAVVAAAALAYPSAALARSHDGAVTRVWQNIYIPPERTIDGDLDVVFGDAQVAGTVTGDCNAMFGTCTAVEHGHILGRTSSFSNDGVRAFLPWAIGNEYGIGALSEQNHRLIVKLAGSLVVVLALVVGFTVVRPRLAEHLRS